MINDYDFKPAFFILFLMIYSLLGCSSGMPSLASQDIIKNEGAPFFIEIISVDSHIPEDFNSYILFIATSPWQLENLTKQQQDSFKNGIKRKFKELGKSIGDKGAAVWVRNLRDDNLSIELGKEYADRINYWYKLPLNYNDGPYLIYLTHSPNRNPSSEKDYAIVINFKYKTPSRILEALNSIEEQIRRYEVSKYGLIWLNFCLDVKSTCDKTPTTIDKSLKYVCSMIKEVNYSKFKVAFK